MAIPLNIMIGNVISLIAGIFVILSLCVNNDKKAYKYQIMNAAILVISSFFFESMVGAVIMAVITIRLYLVYTDRLTFKLTIFFLILAVVMGVAVNTVGWIGLIPIIATIQITICNFAYKDIRWIKLSFIVNEAFYIFYFYFVFDIVSTVVQIITVSIGCISYIHLVKARNREAAEIS